MKGFRRTGDVLEFFDGARVPLSTDGGLVGFLPAEQTYAFNLAFPDVVKQAHFFWTWRCTYQSGRFTTTSTGLAAPAAIPQEWSDIVVIADAPAGANRFYGRLQLFRTAAPSHSWVGKTIFAPAFAGLFVPVGGSLELERANAFGRVLSIYVADGSAGRPGPVGKLVAYIEQSVGGPALGYENYGPIAIGGLESFPVTGGGNTPSATAGIPVWQSTSSPAYKSSFNVVDNPVTPPRWHLEYHRWASSTGDPRVDPPLYADPTNYASTYSVTLVGRFGRDNL